MKFRYVFLLIASLILLFPAETTGQSFEEAVDFYESEDFEEALHLLRQLDQDERVLLYQGKSYLALGQHLKAGILLRKATESDINLISDEAYYSLSLNEFRLTNFDKSLQILHKLKTTSNRPDIRAESQRFYSELLRYITDQQRLELFRKIDNPEIRFDLVRSAVGRSDYTMIRSMILELDKIAEITGDTTQVQLIRDAVGPRDEYYPTLIDHFPPPEGTVYRIGVALPSFESDEPEFEITRNLYFGLLFAAERFNQQHVDKKVVLRYRNTYANPDSVSRIFHELVWNEQVDVLVGPLFSETAKLMSSYAEAYEIPMLSPLANSDDINLGHNYTFQLNPTFSLHGENMARFAVNELGLDTLAVITEQNSLGQVSALSFRHEAESRGAHIAHYIEEDFAALGYDLSDVTEIFTRDSVLVDSLGYVPLDGVYAPFTGQAAHTLINLLMTDLEAMRSDDVVVMGSEEWREARYSDAQRRNFSIYYSMPPQATPDEEELRVFNEDFIRRFEIEPEFFAYAGFDTGRFLLQTLERTGNPKRLKHALRNAPEFNGLALDIYFGQSQINRLVQIEGLTDKAKEFLQRPSAMEPLPDNDD